MHQWLSIITINNLCSYTCKEQKRQTTTSKIRGGRLVILWLIINPPNVNLRFRVTLLGVEMRIRRPLSTPEQMSIIGQIKFFSFSEMQRFFPIGNPKNHLTYHTFSILGLPLVNSHMGLNFIVSTPLVSEKDNKIQRRRGLLFAGFEVVTFWQNKNDASMVTIGNDASMVAFRNDASMVASRKDASMVVIGNDASMVAFGNDASMVAFGNDASFSWFSSGNLL